MVSAPRAERLDALKKSVASSTEVPDIRDESESLAKAYLQALKSEGEGNAKLACNLFEDLSTQKALPIRDAALIHSLNDCSYSASELKSLWAEAQVANYLKEPYFEISKKLALQKDLSAYEAEFSYALIPFKPIQSEKVQLIKRAIEIATKNSDAEKLKYYTEKLKEISPQFNTDINEVNMYKVARDFESSRKFSKARELYKRIVNEKDFSLEEKIKAYNAYRTTYKIERDLKTFLAKTYEMETFLKGEIDFHPGDKKYAEAWVDSKIALARAVWTNHQNSEAQKILDELSKTHLGNSNQLATVQYLFGSLHLENKENIEALKRFEKAIAGTITDSALAENIQWAVVWNNYLLKNDNKAILHIENFTKKSINQAFLAKLNFWKGKSLLRLGKSEEAETTFSSVADADPFGYYGILSSIELKKPFNPLPPAAINTDPTGKFYLDWLIALDEKLFAQKALKEIDSQFKTPEEREKAMSLYYQTEWFQGGMRQIYNFKMSARNSITEKYHSVVFPTPYQLIIDTLAQKYGVPKELIYSITRQESAFVPSERSWADAFGLMQMIPEKAHELSKKYKIPYRDYNDLYKPEINLEMGTALLKDLRSKFNSKFAQTVAAYNASNEVIRIWERERFNGNYVEFIESIPYEETRNYIKLVFRNYITYKRITSKDSFIINKDFFATPF
jgi:soluble lytic murein transglycosylase